MGMGSMLSFDRLLVFVEMHALCKKCGPLLQNHEGLQFSLSSDFLLNNLSGIVYILVNVSNFFSCMLVCDLWLWWQQKSLIWNLVSSHFAVLCQVYSWRIWDSLACAQKQQGQQLAWLYFVGFEQSVAHTGIAKYLEPWMMTCVKQRSRVVVRCTLAHPGTHSSKIRGVDCLIGETELN